jgi:hypothetical protein
MIAFVKVNENKIIQLLFEDNMGMKDALRFDST